MIKYKLICDQNHEFEGWFQGSAAYDEQAANGLLCCPLCDSGKVKRALMTPNLSSPKQRKSTATSADSRPGHAASPDLAPAMQAGQVQAYGAALAELRKLRQKIVKDCRDVGDNFAEEARKIHYGESEAEGIYGQATQEERDSLKDEGIKIYDMPWVPPDH